MDNIKYSQNILDSEQMEIFLIIKNDLIVQQQCSWLLNTCHHVSCLL